MKTNTIKEEFKIRWMKPEDMDRVRAIGDSFDKSIDRFLRRPRSICNVVEIDKKVVGFVFYELKVSKIILVHIAIAPEFRNKKIGQRLMSNLISKLGKRKNIKAKVSEYNTKAQLFLKKMGFKATEVVKEPHEDMYIFNWTNI